MQQMDLLGHKVVEDPKGFVCLVCGWQGSIEGLAVVDGIYVCPECGIVSSVVQNEDLDQHEIDYSWHLRYAREIRELQQRPTPTRVARWEAAWAEDLGGVV